MEIRNFTIMEEDCEGVRRLLPESLKIHWRLKLHWQKALLYPILFCILMYSASSVASFVSISVCVCVCGCVCVGVGGVCVSVCVRVCVGGVCVWV